MMLVVQRNVPAVRALKVPPFPMVDCPIVPAVSLEFATGAEWRWYRVHRNHRRCLVEDELQQMECVGYFENYTPKLDDVGFQLFVACTPHVEEQHGQMRRASVRDPFGSVT